MSTIEERNEYEKNPYFTGHIYGNFSPFYVTIAICSVVLGSIIILNVVLGCCSKYKKYWKDRHTGNRWLVSIWSATPHLQPPLDFTELKDAAYYQSLQHFTNEDTDSQEIAIHPSTQQHIHHERPARPEGRGFHHQRQREEYVELQKRESDI